MNSQSVIGCLCHCHDGSSSNDLRAAVCDLLETSPPGLSVSYTVSPVSSSVKGKGKGLGTCYSAAYTSRL